MALSSNKIIHGNNLPLQHGAIITGSIGMGKSTLRFHIMYYLKNMGHQIIDFDYKGEILNFLSPPQNAIIPGKSLQLNLFDLSLNDSQLTELFIRYSNDLSPAQQNLIRDAVTKSSAFNYNIQQFLELLIYLGFKDVEIDGLKSSQTPVALINRMDWLLHDLSSVFMTNSSSIDIATSEDLFFDLSYLKTQTSQQSVMTIIELILQLIIWKNSKSRPMAIFLEETQLLFDRDANDNFVAEIITTLRHEGIAVFLCGTRIDNFPPLLTDSGTIFQFQSILDSKQNIFNRKMVGSLAQYEFVINQPGYLAEKKYRVLKFTELIQSPGTKIDSSDVVPDIEVTLEYITTAIIRSMILQKIAFKLMELDQDIVLHGSIHEIPDKLKGIWKLHNRDGYHPNDYLWSVIYHSIPGLEKFPVKRYPDIYRFGLELIENLRERISEIETEFLVTSVSPYKSFTK